MRLRLALTIFVISIPALAEVKLPLIDVKKYCLTEIRDPTSHTNTFLKKQDMAQADLYEVCFKHQQNSYNDLKILVSKFRDEGKAGECIYNQKEIGSYSDMLFRCSFFKALGE